MVTLGAAVPVSESIKKNTESGPQKNQLAQIFWNVQLLKTSSLHGVFSGCSPAMSDVAPIFLRLRPLSNPFHQLAEGQAQGWLGTWNFLGFQKTQQKKAEISGMIEIQMSGKNLHLIDIITNC